MASHLAVALHSSAVPHDRFLEMDAAGAASRLAQVAAEGDKVEVILVLRGSVRPVDGSHGARWRVRLEGDRVLTFRAEWVLAARSLTPTRDRD